MRKKTIVRYLANSCFLLPGKIKSSKPWYMSVLSILSGIGLIIAVASCITEVIRYQQSPHRLVENGTTIVKVRRMPVGPVDCCLVEAQNIDNTEPSPPSKTPRVKSNSGPPIPPLKSTPTSAKGQAAPPTSPHEGPPKPELVTDIAHTVDKIFVFVVNILIRIFIWINFSSIIEIFRCIFLSENNSIQNNLLYQIWYDGFQKWSGYEKVYLFTIAISQFQREMDLILEFAWALQEVGIDSVSVPCVLMQIVFEQAKVLFSRELVLEVTTFVLVVFIKTFVNVLWTVALESDVHTDMYDNSKINREFNVGASGSKQLDDMIYSTNNIFTKTSSASKISKKKLKDVTGLIALSGLVSPLERKHLPENIGSEDIHDNSMHIYKKETLKKFNHFDVSEMINSQINFIISMYFDLLGIWERSAKITGFVTLLLFFELATTFCLNTYTTLDMAMKFGLLSSMGACGGLRGTIIVLKLVCVCNSAQELQDMTQVLIDQILQLKLKLLSLPKETYDKSRSGLGENVMNSSDLKPAACERCRGIGNFLTEMVSYIRSHPFELSALGYFSVSRSSMTTITGVIVTYLVVLVQFQSYVSSKPTT